MTKLPDFVLRVLRVLGVGVLLALAACGPGTGGTGTGPSEGIYSYGGMVGTSFGAALSAGVPCTDDCPLVSLRIEPDRVELAAPCRHFTHTGAWSLDALGLAVIDGQLETTSFSADGQAHVDTTAASVRLQFSDARVDSAQVTVTVRDAAGSPLLVPLTLRRGDSMAAGAGACKAPR